jgi:putative tryptophan/tyrosine transport system substrate-binding protein
MRYKAIAFVLVALALATIHPAQAQQPKKIPRIGYMHSAAKPDVTVEAFRQGLRELGYVEGKNIVIEYRNAEGQLERLPLLAAELVHSKVDIIVAVAEVGARAAKNATKTIPIVMVSVGPDPVEVGLVESLGRPGGNVTGFTNLAVELTGKRLELLKEAVPELARVDALYDPAARGTVQEAKDVESTGRALGLTSKSWEVRGSDAFEKVFSALRKDRPNGLYVPGGPLLNANGKLIADFALKTRMPSVYVRKESVEVGGLISYGVDPVDHYRRAASYVDKILKGTKPAELPVEQPTKFELVINLKTAKQIGLTIPPHVLARADKIIK